MKCINAAEAIFPSLGFFGGVPDIALAISVGKKVRAVRIVIPSSEPTYLNLLGVDIATPAGHVNDGNIKYREVVSSSLETDTPIRLLKNQAIHTELESQPWWECRFDEDYFVDSVSIFNRTDTWARRAQKLEIHVLDEADRWEVLHQNHCIESAIECMMEFLKSSNFLLAGPVESPEEFRLKIIKTFSLAIANGSYIGVSLRHLMALLPIWRRETLSDDELTICAYFLLERLRVDDDFAISYFSAPLFSTKQIERLDRALNSILSVRNLEPVMITRHGIQPKGKLHTQREAFIAAAHRVIGILDGASLKPAICYGTLLGAVRANEFIAHDDDLDVICEILADDERSARISMGEVIGLLNKSGFRADFASDAALNVHAFDLENDALIDIFPYWVKQGQAFLHMERMKIRPISKDILDGRSKVAVYGRPFPVPAKAELFLSERYGINWRTPMIYFEWPWRIDSDD